MSTAPHLDPLPSLDDAALAAPRTRPAATAPAARPARPTPEQLLEGLNPPQREAVLHEGGPVLVVAGAGSGKTRVLTRRIAYLVSERRVHPGSILAITFTNKAAAEMRGRVMDLVGNRAKLMWVSTFHSACVRILRSEIGRFNISRSFSIYDDADSRRLMQMVAHDLDLDPKRFPVRSLMNWVSNCKNDLVDHESAQARAETPVEESNAEAYREYQRRLIAANALDFDDLIMTTVHLLQAFPDLREQYRRRFRHVLVDEYQDTNHAQYALVRELCSQDLDGEAISADPDGVAISPPELMVVGDSDQSIYAFRGATIRNIDDFESDFPGARVIMLEQNYRSTQTILNAANAVIGQNAGRKPKNLWSDAGDGQLITGYVADTEHDEAQFVAGEIQRLREAGEGRYADAAVFYRTNAQSRTFEEVFIRVGLPYKVVGGVRFYERREVRDAVAYLRAIGNRTDDVSLRRLSGCGGVRGSPGLGGGTEGPGPLGSVSRGSTGPLLAVADLQVQPGALAGPVQPDGERSAGRVRPRRRLLPRRPRHHQPTASIDAEQLAAEPDDIAPRRQRMTIGGARRVDGELPGRDQLPTILAQLDQGRGEFALGIPPLPTIQVLQL